MSQHHRTVGHPRNGVADRDQSLDDLFKDSSLQRKGHGEEEGASKEGRNIWLGDFFFLILYLFVSQ